MFKLLVITVTLLLGTLSFYKAMAADPYELKDKYKTQGHITLGNILDKVKVPEGLGPIIPVDQILNIVTINNLYSSSEDQVLPSKELVEMIELENFDATLNHINVSETKLKEIAPGSNVFKGSVATIKDITAHKRSIQLAMIFNHLSKNIMDKNDARINLSDSVRSGDLFNFLIFLKASGHKFELSLSQRPADFLGLYTRVNNQIIPILAPVFIDTQINSALVPAPHSEIIIKISGKNVNATVKWFQGIDGVKFRAVGSWEPHPLSGEKRKLLTTKTRTSLEAIILMAIYQKILITKASDNNRAMYDYGFNGLCNNGSALVEKYLTDKVTVYPLIADKVEMVKYIDQFISELGTSIYTKYLSEIAKIVKALPNDNKDNLTRKERALNSLVKVNGEFPFKSQEKASKALKN